jgi:hypothetical protein
MIPIVIIMEKVGPVQMLRPGGLAGFLEPRLLLFRRH